MEKYMKFVKATWYLMTLLVATAIVLTVTNIKFDDLKSRKMSQPYEFVSLKERQRQLKCMADNIYWEAASEPAEGKIAVAQIVMNRIESSDFPDDPCRVIYQKNIFYERVVCQFSWYCEGNYKTRAIHHEQYQESYEAAKMVLLEGFRLPGLKDALYYHADYVNPRWNKIKVAKIGRHIFYKPKEV